MYDRLTEEKVIFPEVLDCDLGMFSAYFLGNIEYVKNNKCTVDEYGVSNNSWDTSSLCFNIFNEEEEGR